MAYNHNHNTNQGGIKKVKKHSTLIGNSDSDIKRYYILTRPAKLSEMALDEIDNDMPDTGWREKSRLLQARRWRKIRHQLV